LVYSDSSAPITHVHDDIKKPLIMVINGFWINSL
jgi:hypothetical protein